MAIVSPLIPGLRTCDEIDRLVPGIRSGTRRIDFKEPLLNPYNHAVKRSQSMADSVVYLRVSIQYSIDAVDAAL